MSIKIYSRWDSSKVIYESETAEAMKDAVIEAVSKYADLSRANLSWADLSGADLSGANLSGADLSRANLSRADLSGANLYGADLSGADLSRANLSRANLSGADLSGANLYGANLYGANLSGADLSRANLSRANLYGADGAQPERCTPLLMLLDQPGPIRLYKIVNKDGYGPFRGGLRFEVGQSYEVPEACCDPQKQCGSGIHIATLDWCLREWCDGYRCLIVEFTADDIACIPTATDGKIRLKRCTVVGEKDLSAIVNPAIENSEVSE